MPDSADQNPEILTKALTQIYLAVLRGEPCPIAGPEARAVYEKIGTADRTQLPGRKDLPGV
jgi:hypothetical protein